MSEWELDKLLREINGEICQLQTCLGKEAVKAAPPSPRVLRLSLVKKKASGGRAPPKVSNAQAASSHSRDMQQVCSLLVWFCVFIPPPPPPCSIVRGGGGGIFESGWLVFVCVFLHFIIPFGTFGLPYLGKATAAARAALPSPASACWVFSCFHNPLDMDYWIFNMRM